MTTDTTTATLEETTAPIDRVKAAVGRLAALDGLRGLIIVVMALDHANAFVAHGHPPPEFWSGPPAHYTSTLAFLTRFVTHFAAPGFFFLMGAGMALFAESRRTLGWSEWAIVRHLVLRGGVLIALQLLVENPAWRVGSGGPIFSPQVFFSYFGVLYGLGAAMIAGALLLRLRPAALIGLGLVAELATELVISALRRTGGAPGPLLQLLLVPGRAAGFTVYYPLIPWLGLALFGMAFGRWLTRNPAQAYRRAAISGAVLLALFAALRLAGGFGNLQPPAGTGWIALLNVVKYPPSLVFIALTLGVDLLLLALLASAGDRLKRWGQPLLVFGRSPLFFYVAHLYLYGLIGLAIGPRGTGIPRMYPFWLLGLAILYPLCWMYGKFKHRQGQIRCGGCCDGSQGRSGTLRGYPASEFEAALMVYFPMGIVSSGHSCSPAHGVLGMPHPKRLQIPQKARPSILGDYPFAPDEVRWLVGRSDADIFVLLTHLPSGRSRSQTGLRDESLDAVERKLLALLHADVAFDPHEIRIDVGQTGVGPFIRVRHVPTGFAQSQAGLNGATQAEVERQLLIALHVAITAANTKQ